LGALSSIGNLGIHQNNSLTSLVGLEALTTIGGLSLFGNQSLISCNGMNQLSSIAGDFYVDYNVGLTSFTGLNNVASIGGRFVVYENPAMTSFTGLEGLNSIGSYLYIGSNPTLTSLSALGNLTSIGGGIDIYGNGMLTSLSGLDNIDASSIADLSIADNGSLSTCEVQSICGFLSSPNGDVNIYNNASGCNNPSEVASGCGISMPCLPYGHYYFLSQSDIDNFEANYPGCTELHGNVTIKGDDITNFTGLNVVTSIGGNLSIGDWSNGNPLLTSLAGLDNLTSVGGELMIGHNYALSSLAGLDNIAAGSITNLIIVYNTSLTSCAVQNICDYLIVLHGSYALQGNAIGCRNIAEVETDCADVTVNEIIEQHEISLFPNPAENRISFTSPDAVAIDEMVIHNQTGQIVLRGKPVSKALDISKLLPGLYIVELGSGQWKMRKKLVIK
jgi:hypothetical protein